MNEKQILMVGDSMIEYGPWENWFGDHVANRGIGGLTTEGVYQHLNRILRKPYDVIAIMAGVNDLLIGLSIETAGKNYERILNKIKEQQPTAEVYVHRPLPCYPEKLGIPLSNRRIQALGEILWKLADRYEAHWVDLWDLYAVNEALDPTLTFDGLHLTEAAYQSWGDRLAGLFKA